MRCVAKLTCVFFAVAGVSSSVAQGWSVDWKFYGGVSVQGDEQECFYDAKGVVQTPDRDIRVWIKCLAQKDLDSINIEKAFGGRILKNTAAKIAHYYMPPIGNIQTLDVGQAMSITQYEETANISYI
jgi:hypothetical protein